jgi:hypothetical protein
MALNVSLGSSYSRSHFAYPSGSSGMVAVAAAPPIAVSSSSHSTSMASYASHVTPSRPPTVRGLLALPGLDPATWEDMTAKEVAAICMNVPRLRASTVALFSELAKYPECLAVLPPRAAMGKRKRARETDSESSTSSEEENENENDHENTSDEVPVPESASLRADRLRAEGETGDCLSIALIATGFLAIGDRVRYGRERYEGTIVRTWREKVQVRWDIADVARADLQGRVIHANPVARLLRKLKQKTPPPVASAIDAQVSAGGSVAAAPIALTGSDASGMDPSAAEKRTGSDMVSTALPAAAVLDLTRQD